MCLKLLNSIPLINYDEHTRRYSFNPMFDGFILQELSTLMKKIRENEQTETKIPRGIK